MKQRQNNMQARRIRQDGFDPTEQISSLPSRLIDRFNSWRLGITVDGETVLKAVIIGVLTVFFTLLQTTFFTRFRPFGAIPDLMLPFVIAVGTLEKERWGAVWALVAAFFIDAAGGTQIMLLPLLYVPAAFTVGILTTHRFRDSFTVAAVYTAVTSVLRGVITFIIVTSTVSTVTSGQIFTDIVLPELASNLVIAAFPQLLTRAVLRPFHKTRAERTGR